MELVSEEIPLGDEINGGKWKLAGLSAEKLEQEENATVTSNLVNYQLMNQREQNQNYLQNTWLE